MKRMSPHVQDLNSSRAKAIGKLRRLWWQIFPPKEALRCPKLEVGDVVTPISDRYAWDIGEVICVEPNMVIVSISETEFNNVQKVNKFDLEKVKPQTKYKK